MYETKLTPEEISELKPGELGLSAEERVGLKPDEHGILRDEHGVSPEFLKLTMKKQPADFSWLKYAMDQPALYKRNRLRRWMVTYFGWHIAKKFGDLTILNRISVLSLVIVPLISALWSFIYLILLEIFEQREVLLISGSDLEFSVPDRLPTFFALTFLAALLALVARTLYEIFAPEDLRRFTEVDFISFKLERFRNHPTKEQLIEALQHATDEDGIRRATAVPPKYMDVLIHFKKFGELPKDSGIRQYDLEISNDEEQMNANRRLVAAGAEVVYRQLANSNWMGAAICSMLYLAASSIVLWISLDQIWSVFRTAGWL